MNKKSEINIGEQKETPIESRKIYTTSADPEVESLYGKYKRGKLILQSDFQRHFVWDAKKSSRLIESALLDIPLPVIYLSEESDGKEIVIDGQQRLTSFFSFIDGVFPGGKPFKLNNLKVFQNLNKKTYQELHETLQDKIRYCKLRTITFSRDTNHDLKFEIFERLNSGAVSLNQQELRNCIYRGKYNEVLKMLSLREDFVNIVGQEPPRNRMRNVELVLRFAAFYHATYLHYKPPMLHFLNNEMEESKDITDVKIIELVNAFKNTTAIINTLFGEHAFKRFYSGNSNNPNGYWESQRFNASLYDIMMYSFAKEDKNKVYQHLDSIREALICLMTEDQEFIDSIERGTSGLKAVVTRFDKWRSALQGIIGIGQKEQRCFSLKLKEELYNANPTCAICQQRIQHIDDSAVDHIEQYWIGGKTIPDNARLTHRYCNISRSKYDVVIQPPLQTKFSKINKAIDENNFSNRKPSAFIFEGNKFLVNQWNEILVTLCTYLYEKYGNEFEIVLDLHGTKRNYFKTNPVGMDIPMKISDSEYYVETKWNAVNTIKFCNKIIEKFGYEKSELKIEFR